MVGLKFNRWTVLSHHGSNKWGSRIWLCRCECGTERVVAQGDLKRGHTKSCGCYGKEVAVERHLTHGMTRTKVYDTWCHMKSRCMNVSDVAYRYYGARGIAIHDTWVNSFETFLQDMGEPPSAASQIDRIDNEGDYSPYNCRWVTQTENCRNRRSNHNITIGHETMCLTEWSERIGMPSRVLRERIVRRGWTVARAFNTPVRVATDKGVT